MSYLKKEKRSICYAKLYHRTKTKEGTIFLNVNNLPGKILPLKLITLREMSLNGLCPKGIPLLLVESKTFRGRKGINLLVYACCSNSLFSFLIF